jgi:hypothetical protein
MGFKSDKDIAFGHQTASSNKYYVRVWLQINYQLFRSINVHFAIDLIKREGNRSAIVSALCPISKDFLS